MLGVEITRKKLTEMITLIFGTIAGFVVGALVTAGHNRSSEAIEVRRAIAKLKRHLDIETDYKLGTLERQLRDNLACIDNAEHAFALSVWANGHRIEFVRAC